MLGAEVARQLLTLGLHLVPILLGSGTPLFAGERAELVAHGEPVAGAATHFRFRVAGS